MSSQRRPRKCRNKVRGFSARAPCDGSAIPRVVARRNRHGARLKIAARRRWWWARWRNGSAAVRPRKDGLGPAFALRAVRRLAVMQNRDARYRIPRLLSPRHTAQLLIPGSPCTLSHRPHKHLDRPHSPLSSTARRPQNWPKSPISLAALDAPRRRIIVRAPLRRISLRYKRGPKTFT